MSWLSQHCVLIAMRRLVLTRSARHTVERFSSIRPASQGSRQRTGERSGNFSPLFKKVDDCYVGYFASGRSFVLFIIFCSAEILYVSRSVEIARVTAALPQEEEDSPTGAPLDLHFRLKFSRSHRSSIHGHAPQGECRRDGECPWLCGYPVLSIFGFLQSKFLLIPLNSFIR